MNFPFVSISGWGDTGDQKTSTDKLQKTQIPIVESSNCLTKENLEGDENLIVCARGAKAGPCKVNWKPRCHQVTPCVLSLTQGDSGGPLTVDEEGAHVLVGIVSRRLGESCNQQDYAVFTSVSAHLPWIESSIKENGGMASCSFNISAPPTLGMSHTNKVRSKKKIRHYLGIFPKPWTPPPLLGTRYPKKKSSVYFAF